MAEEGVSHTIRADRILSIASTQEAVNLGEETVALPSTPYRTADHSSNKQFAWLTTTWRRHVSVSVPHVKCRDHLANERTALAWVRTAQAFAMLGVVVAQLMRLNHSTNPNPVLGFFVVSVPLSSMCHIMALMITCVGLYRFLHWQGEMTRGNAISSGWELLVVGTFTTLILISMFVLVLSISIEQTEKGVER